MRSSPWPVALVTGALGSGKTTFIKRLLMSPEMADTLVLVNEFGEVGLDHLLFKAVTDNVILLANGCLCCQVRQDIVQTLREIYRDWLIGRSPDFGRVIIETSGVADPAPLTTSIVSHPLLAGVYTLQAITTMVDGEYGLERLSVADTGLNQILLADHLVVTKADRVAPTQIAQLQIRLAALNALADVRRAETIADPDVLFRRLSSRLALSCDWGAHHLDGITSLLLESSGVLLWAAFKAWLGELLETHGERILRLKGRLSFESHDVPVILQAVHHSFYPIEPAPAVQSGDKGDFLVLVFSGSAPVSIAERFGELPVAAPRPKVALGH
jgi:G3E family GTPase